MIIFLYLKDNVALTVLTCSYYSLSCSTDLFIGFIYWIWWLYLWHLSIGFSFSIYSIYPFSQQSNSDFRTAQKGTPLHFFHLYISHVLMEKIFCFPLRHHTHLIKLTLLQLHHRTSLIKLTNITSLHHNYNTCSILTLHFSNITSHYSESIHLQIPSDIQLLRLSSIFISLTQRCTSHSIFNYIWNTSKLLLLSGNVEINPGPRPINQNPVFRTICSSKINEGLSKIWHLPAPTKNAMHIVTKSVMVDLPAKLIMRKILVTLSPGNVPNMALESPKLLCHLLQFMYFQVVPLLLENLAPFARLLFAPIMLI